MLIASITAPLFFVKSKSAYFSRRFSSVSDGQSAPFLFVAPQLEETELRPTALQLLYYGHLIVC